MNIISIERRFDGMTRVTFAVGASERIQMVVPSKRATPATIEALRRQVEKRFVEGRPPR